MPTNLPTFFFFKLVSTHAKFLYWHSLCYICFFTLVSPLACLIYITCTVFLQNMLICSIHMFTNTISVLSNKFLFKTMYTIYIYIYIFVHVCQAAKLSARSFFTCPLMSDKPTGFSVRRHILREQLHAHAPKIIDIFQNITCKFWANLESSTGVCILSK